MASILHIANVQVPDTQSDHVMSNCLRTSVILRTIFQCFSTTELIQLSCVNKQWNYQARSLMKSRGNLIACMSKHYMHRELRTFASDLQRMKEIIVPFSGLKIAVGGTDPEGEYWGQQGQNIDMDPVHEEILGGLTWKHLSVSFYFHPTELQYQYCPEFLLLKKILENFAQGLEEFSIEPTDADAANYFTKECLQHCSFSSLKTFGLLDELEPEDEATGPEYTDMIKTVVSRSPNLQAFHSNVKVDLNGNLLEGSSAVHVIGRSYLYFLREIPESLAGQLRFPEYDLFELAGLSLEKFSSITSKLLLSSRTIMTSIVLDVVFLAPLMTYGICLENVRKLRMSVDLCNVKKKQSHIWKLVTSFDFTRIFAKLDKVNIIHVSYNTSCLRADFNELIEHENASPKTTTPDRAAHVKQMKLQCLPGEVLRQRSSFRLLAQMYPDVQKLSIEDTYFPFAHIGGIWAKLKEVHVRLQRPAPERRPINLDSEFCGIFPQEVAYLREQDEEYLRRVHIVPVMPSIVYLKGLRTFAVRFYRAWERSNDPFCTFSKVSGLIAFQRCPNLSVVLTTEDERLEQALSHMKPYATVVLKNGSSV